MHWNASNYPVRFFHLSNAYFSTGNQRRKECNTEFQLHTIYISSLLLFGSASDPSRSNCTWGSACTRAARRSSFSRHRASFIRINRAQEPGQTDVSSGASEELEKCWMISLFYFHKSATELALLGVNTGELSLSWSKNDPLARGQPYRDICN